MSEPRQDGLARQISLMNRVQAALSSSLKSDDVHALVLATLTSPSGLGFQRAFLFLRDPQSGALRGRLAMGPSTREEALAAIAEQEAEAKALDQIAAAMSSEEGDGDDGDDGGSMFDLRHSAHWIDTLQASGPAGELASLAATIEIPCGGGPASEGAKPSLASLLDERKPKEVARDDFALPEALANVLPERFAVIPLKTASGPRGLALADRRFDPAGEEIGRARLESLEWFQAQTTLALDNAELYTSLQRTCDDLRELDRHKSNFLSTVSHELRTPLTAINGFVQLLADGRVGPLTPTQQGLMDRVRLQGAHMANMVNDLIEMTEFQMGGLDEMDLEPVDPLECLLNAMPKLEPRRLEKGIEIEPKLGAGPLPLVSGNARALERVYYHLLDNAIKFSEEGGKVEVAFLRPEPGLVRVEVRDEGIGIETENLGAIFNNFYQVDNNLTRSRNGLGLGLTVTKILLESTGGSIEVESVPNQGSVFAISYRVWSEEVDARPGSR